ncbi:MAG: glutathione S-transferase N-terminal domain-containing protein [Acidiferrobacterales bacterium]|nr:glutathione S-transferase N-terminal domain-containing protein [Acidiferrobacterales bacterium]
MKLYGSLTSPYVRKVRVLLIEKNIPCELLVCDPHQPDSIVQRHNPLGKVPVLERDDGSNLFDSPVIIEYLDGLGSDALIPAAGESRWRVLRWQALADGILDAVVTRLLETRRPGERQSPEAMTLQESKIARALAFADESCGAKSYLLNGRFTLADLALGVALAYVDFRYPHDWRSKHRRLASWFAATSARSSFVETQPPA